MIEIHLKIDSLYQKALTYKICNQNIKVDSLNLIIDDYKNKFTFLTRFYNINFNEVENKLKSYFGLNEINDKERDYFFTYCAYKVHGPNSGCIGPFFDSDNEAISYYKREEEKKKIYTAYADSILNESRKINFPNVKENELNALNYTIQKILSDGKSFDPSFFKNSLKYLVSDTTFMKLKTRQNKAYSE